MAWCTTADTNNMARELLHSARLESRESVTKTTHSNQNTCFSNTRQKSNGHSLIELGILASECVNALAPSLANSVTQPGDSCASIHSSIQLDSLAVLCGSNCVNCVTGEGGFSWRFKLELKSHFSPARNMRHQVEEGKITWTREKCWYETK